MQSFGRLDIISPTLTQPISLRRRFVWLSQSLVSCCLPAFVLASILFSCGRIDRAQTPSSTTDSGIHVDLPSSGRLRVENRFGNVDVEVWQQRDVSVALKITGNGTFKRSPVVIELKDDLLSIKIVRAPLDPQVPVGIILRIPKLTHAEIITSEGAIASRGLSDSMLLQTTSGNIRAELDNPPDADILARSVNGPVVSTLGTTATRDDVHTFQSRLGTGKRILRANSQFGEVSIAPRASADRPAETASRRPELLGTSGSSKGAGTPEKRSPSEEVGEGDVIRVDTQLVTLNLSVIDRSTSRGLAGLIESDFKLFEDGVEQNILRFDSSAAPFDLVLLIDLSGSTRDVVKLIRAAARHFIDAARPMDRIAVITFAGGPTLISPLTNDRETLRQRVDGIDTLHGDTKLYDAAAFAIDEVLKETKGSRRTAIVLMSDGLDGTIPGVHGQQGSKLSYRELIDRVREFDGVLYTLWLNTYYEALNPQDTQPEAFDTGYDQMKELADAGGGLFYEVERLEDLAGAYERVVADLGTVYSLAYRPANKTRDGKWRAIRVSVARPNAVARGKHGYYAN